VLNLGGAAQKSVPGGGVAGRAPAVFVVSGPSGAGKSTLVRKVLAMEAGLRFSVSATTREARPGETDGVDYHFVTGEEFRGMIDRGEFLEHAEVFGDQYGTPRTEIDAARAEGLGLLVEIDVQGAAQLEEALSDAVRIFVKTDALEELERRLRGRSTETEEVIRRRLKVAEEELAEASKYDYVVVNDDADAAARRLHEIIVTEKCRPEREGA